MKSLFLVAMMFSFSAFAQEKKVGTKIVFDHNGQRQMASVGANPQTKGDQLITVASWLAEVKNGSKSSFTAKVDLNSPNTVAAVPSYKMTMQGQSVEIKEGSKILGKDNNIYEVAGVFTNGEVALRLVEHKYGKLRTQYNTFVKNIDFISSLETNCIGRICKGAYVREEDPSLLCMQQKPDYYKKNKLVEDHKLTEKCNRYENSPKSADVLAVFLDGSVLTSFNSIRNILEKAPAEEAPAGVEQ